VWRRDEREGCATHADAGVVELLVDRTPMNAQLGTDLAQGLALGIQIGGTVNIHGATVTILSMIGTPVEAAQVAANGARGTAEASLTAAEHYGHIQRERQAEGCSDLCPAG
jgi:hypothetical protein